MWERCKAPEGWQTEVTPPPPHSMRVSEAADWIPVEWVEPEVPPQQERQDEHCMGQVNLLSPLLPASLWLLSTTSLCHGYPQHSRNPTNDPTLPPVWGILKRQALENKKRFEVLPTWDKACVLTYTLYDLRKSPMTSDLSLLHCKGSLTPWLASQGLGDTWAAHTIQAT